jgi:hypothetical protein
MLLKLFNPDPGDFAAISMVDSMQSQEIAREL